MSPTDQALQLRLYKKEDSTRKRSNFFPTVNIVINHFWKPLETIFEGIITKSLYAVTLSNTQKHYQIFHSVELLSNLRAASLQLS